MNYYKRHLGDYAKETGDLTALQHGVYNLLLDRYYADERPIPERKVYSIAKARNAAERAAVDFVLKEYFEFRDGDFLNRNCDFVIQASREKSKQASEAAKARFINDDSMRTHSETDADAVRNGSGRSASHKPLATSHKPEALEAQSSLRSDSPSTAARSDGQPAGDADQANAKPPEKPQSTAKAPTLAQITEAAITAFNAKLGKPNGLLPAVALKVGRKKREQQVKRSLEIVREICALHDYEPADLAGDFWNGYFGEVDNDDFRSGRLQPGNGHENWTPTFEYLTRPRTVLEVYDRASESAAPAPTAKAAPAATNAPESQRSPAEQQERQRLMAEFREKTMAALRANLPGSGRQPRANDDFHGKVYEGTDIAKLPADLRAAVETELARAAPGDQEAG